MNKNITNIVIALFLVLGLIMCNSFIEKRAVGSVIRQINDNNGKYRKFKWTELIDSSPSDRAFVNSLYTINNVYLCPRDFRQAFNEYVEAWKQAVDHFEKYNGLNGIGRILLNGPEVNERTSGSVKVVVRVQNASHNMVALASKYSN